MRIDFHLHTHRSDGTLTPAELLNAVHRAGVDAFAVTDHDTLAGFAALRGEAGLIPGVEVTAGLNGREVHIVGLGIDPDDAAFAAFLAAIRATRRQRLQQLIARLPENVRRGLTFAALCEDPDARHADALGRLHLARALLRRGGVANIHDAFALHLGDDHTVDAGLEPYPHPTVCRDAIRAAGGVAILAHPGVYPDAGTVTALMAHGLDGLELDHPNLDPDLATQLAALAATHGWLASAGSDLHFLGNRKPGGWSPDDARQQPLLERLGLRAG